MLVSEHSGAERFHAAKKKQKQKNNLLPEMLNDVARAGDDVSCAIKQHIPLSAS